MFGVTEAERLLAVPIGGLAARGFRLRPNRALSSDRPSRWRQARGFRLRRDWALSSCRPCRRRQARGFPAPPPESRTTAVFGRGFDSHRLHSAAHARNRAHFAPLLAIRKIAGVRRVRRKTLLGPGILGFCVRDPRSKYVPANVRSVRKDCTSYSTRQTCSPCVWASYPASFHTSRTGDEADASLLLS